MSIKNNTTLLNSLLEQVNNLPDAVQAENLDAEIAAQNAIIAEQDAKIAELAEVLAGKAGGGNNSGNIETWTGSITEGGMLPPVLDYYSVLYYTDNLLKAKMLKITDIPTTITIAKNTLFYITGGL